MPGDLPQPFEVGYSAALRKKLAFWGKQAVQFGIKQQMLDALRAMDAGLSSDPLAWGDPQYHFVNLKLVACHRLYPPLYVTYAVDVEGRKVHVREIRPYSNLPFTDNPET
jgi:hypothetical protein